MTFKLLAACSFALLLGNVMPAAQTQTLVPFTVGGKALPALSIFVPPNTSDEQLTALINAFRTARIKGTLGQMIPPTTPKAAKGPYAAVDIYVLSDRAAMGDAFLNMFTHPKTRGVSDNEKQYGQRILANYFYTALAGPGTAGEEGTLGYKADGYLYTSRYKKLF